MCKHDFFGGGHMLLLLLLMLFSDRMSEVMQEFQQTIVSIVEKISLLKSTVSLFL
jgi:hypothetical protein